MFNKIKRYARDPYYALGYDMIKECPNLMSDRFYISILWKMVMGYELDWKHLKTFNEKLQWLKLYDHNPLYTTLVDKYRVKRWVADKIGEQYVIPTLAVYKSVDEIDLDKLPNLFVLKCNHDSGSVVVCRDKASFDLEGAKQKLGEGLKHNFYWDAREWSYKNVKRCVFAEQYMEDKTTDSKDLLTYKFLCFEGVPYLMYVTVKGDSIWENYYDMDYCPLDIRRDFPTNPKINQKPLCFAQMKEMAAALSRGIKHVRIDLYEVDGKVFFSEFTFYDWGGLMKFKPDEWDLKLGEKIHLPIR